jgi:hypothetical protein
VLVAAALALLVILPGRAGAAPTAGGAAGVEAALFDQTAPLSPPPCPPTDPICTPPPGSPPPPTTASPTATATAKPKPKATPEPTPPPTAAPTQKPTPYVEPIVATGTPVGLPAEHSSIAITPVANPSGSSLLQLVLVAMVALAVIAGATLFLFFKLR